MNVEVSAVASLMIGDRTWILPAVVIAVFGLLLSLWLNRSRLRRHPVGPVFRVIGWVLLCACLFNPLWSSQRPRSGANIVAVIVDTSRSHLTISRPDEGTRADAFRRALTNGEKSEPVGWLTRLSQDFELRRYTVSDRLQQVTRFDHAEFDGTASSLNTALVQLRTRFDGQPLAAIILLSDGLATDTPVSREILRELPPIYAVPPPSESPRPDVSAGTFSITQTAFDDAPLTLTIQPGISNVTSGKLAVSLMDSDGKVIETQDRSVSDPTPVRFRHRPREAGTGFYRVRVELRDESGNPVTGEVTDINNEQLIAVDRGAVPRRVLYVSGRPNWEFKFLRRAIETDPQVQLVALIRIARKEARFDFRGNAGERSNSLFRGFDNQDPETTEEFDEPVLVRLNTRDAEELRGGFPQKSEDLFQYDAILLDDVEADFFLADQMKLIYDFVSRRGGGLMMMGGQETFRQGEYDRTPIGEMLPVDLSREVPSPQSGVRLRLTRDGWLQPWVRLRSDETEETARLNAMPDFLTLNTAAFVRPGAMIMAEVTDEQDNHWPALVVQRFGKGRTAALCIGDLWRWRLHEGFRSLQESLSAAPITTLDAASLTSRRAGASGAVIEEDLTDHARACRQMIRWLVSESPRRLDTGVREDTSLGTGAVTLTAFVRGADFEARENADVRFTVTAPDGSTFELAGEPSDTQPGLFEASLSAPLPGAWHAGVTAGLTDDEAGQILTGTFGWASQPDQKEFRSVDIDQSFLSSLAQSTGGRVVPLSEIGRLADSLPQASAPLVETWSWPLWHSWWIFLAAITCFSIDWALRRRNGLP